MSQKDINAADAPKSADEIFNEQLETGLAEHNRAPKALFMSAMAAGMEVGFSLLLVGMVYTSFQGKIDETVLHYLTALAYPLGFIFVVIGRSELFTEHTTLAVIPVLNRSTSIKSLLKVWGIVYAGNLVGGYLIAIFLASVAPNLELISVDTFTHLAKKLVELDWNLILWSAVLAGWLMGLLSWLVTSSQETFSRILIVFIITMVIGIGGLHHSIVGSIDVFAGVSLSTIGLEDYLFFQLWATIGNIIGGVFFVSILKFGSIRNNDFKRYN